MARRTLQKIKPFHPQEAFQPPDGAVAAGVTPDGKQLYRWSRKRSRAVPLYVRTPEAEAREVELRAQGKSTVEIGQIMTNEGFRQYQLNQMTGKLAYPLNRPEAYVEDKLFFIESQGNGNNALIEYNPPTPKQIEAQYRQEQVRQMGGGRLGELLVEEGLTPEDLIAAIRQQRLGQQAEEATTTSNDEPSPALEDLEDEAVIPQKPKRGRWPTKAERTAKGR